MEHQIKGGAKQFAGKVKEQWSDVTDNDLKRYEGKLEDLAGFIETKYGQSKDKVKEKLEGFMNSTDDKISHLQESLSELASKGQEKLAEGKDYIKENASELCDSVSGYVEQKPFKSLLIAALAGAALAMLVQR